MSVVNIRAALETALNAMTPALATAWENSAFSPPGQTTPFQQVAILFAQPENLEFGSSYRQAGYMQITLQYPLQTGPSAAATRAELIKSVFPRGASFVKSGTTVVIEKTPEVSPGYVDGDRYSVPVKVRFFSNIN
ncbi:MAG: phage tail terminator-like protein [Gallionella sp.]|nr:phage tail terminator-like protein [Gallionella sp.]